MSGVLRVDSLSKRFGESEAVREVSLAIESGELVVFVGPSGSGKSTLLRMIAGLERPSGGTVRLDGRDITTAGPAKRDMAMVFQSYALYPHMSVAENLAFSLEMAGVEREARRRRVVEVARTLEIEPLLERRPRELSGGQRQRVAIGRAIVREPRVFLFDEPLSNLDAELRVRMRLELSELHTRLSATMVYVTHDQVEAMTLADRIVVLRDGAVEQVGTPISLYNDPDTVFVAGFLGTPRMNLLPARVVGHEGGRCRVHVPALGEEPLPVAPRTPGAIASGTITLGIRPGRLQARLDPGSAPSHEVRVVERLGNETHLHFESAGEPITIAIAGQPDVERGRSVGLDVDPGDCQLFDGDGRRL